MIIKLLMVGKTDDASIKKMIERYQKRLSHYTRLELEILPDLKNLKKIAAEQQKIKEGELILEKLSNADWVVLLDEKGGSYTSEGFADFIQKRLNSGMKQLVFIVGGPYGFSEAVYKRANDKISLSKMTFSHQMVRIFFIEQLYRAFTILKNEPYHHK